MKIVLDTNVLLAGIFTHGLCEALLDACLDDSSLELFTSEHILGEFAEHAGKFGAPPADVADVLDFLRLHFRVITPSEVHRNACRDLDDLPVLGTAFAARADYLVTGDKDLLVLKQFESAAIISARTMYERIQRA